MKQIHIWQELMIVSKLLKCHDHFPTQFEIIPIIEINYKLIHNFHLDNFR